MAMAEKKRKESAHAPVAGWVTVQIFLLWDSAITNFKMLFFWPTVRPKHHHKMPFDINILQFAYLFLTFKVVYKCKKFNPII